MTLMTAAQLDTIGLAVHSAQGLDEQWRPVTGYEDAYQISSHGRVYSLLSSIILKPTLTRNGYLRVELRGVKKLVHVLVAEAFIGPCPDGQEVRHLDGDQLSNRWPENITYGTPSENCLDMVSHGTHNWARKTHCPAGHEYTPANTRIFRERGGGLGRSCRTCHRIRNREWARAARNRKAS